MRIASPYEQLEPIMDTTPITATLIPQINNQWMMFRIEGLELDLDGKSMEHLLKGDVTIYEEDSHHNLCVSTESANSTRFVELFGRQAYSHLVALARGQKQPVGSLDELPLNLQRALERRRQHLLQRDHRPLMA